MPLCRVAGGRLAVGVTVARTHPSAKQAATGFMHHPSPPLCERLHGCTACPIARRGRARLLHMAAKYPASGSPWRPANGLNSGLVVGARVAWTGVRRCFMPVIGSALAPLPRSAADWLALLNCVFLLAGGRWLVDECSVLLLLDFIRRPLPLHISHGCNPPIFPSHAPPTAALMPQ